MPSRATSKRTAAPKTGTLERVAHGQTLLIRKGSRAVAAVIPIEDYRLLKKLLREKEDELDVRDALEALKEPGSIPWDRLKAELGL
jgi:prevent-host-death family protein